MRVPDFFRTTAFRLSLAAAGFFTVSSIAVFAFVYWQTVAYASEEIDEEVAQVGHAIGGARRPYVERRLGRWLAEQNNVARYGLLLDDKGAKLAGNLERMPDSVSFDGLAHTLAIAELADTARGPEIVRAVALRRPDGLVLLVAEDTDEWEHFRDVLARALILGLVPIGVLGCLSGALFGRSTLARTAVMERSLDRIVHGDLSQRLDHATDGGDEFDRLARRVNLVLEDLHRLLEESQAVGDSIAHDLRTPLTRMRARLDNARLNAQSVEELRAALDEAAYWLDQTFAVITAVLRIGEIEHAGRRAAFRDFEAADLAREVHDLMEPLAEEKGVAFSVRLDARNLQVTGDRELILEALVNLVDNAIKFTPPGGACVLSVSNPDGRPCFRVCDTGPGIAQAERSAVMRRFYKGRGHRHSEGNGLGLALVAAVARLHDFSFRIDDGAPGAVMELAARPAAPLDPKTPSN